MECNVELTNHRVKFRTMSIFNCRWLYEDAIVHLTGKIPDSMDSAIVLPVLLVELDANPFSGRERGGSPEPDDPLETLNGSYDSTKGRSVIRHSQWTIRLLRMSLCKSPESVDAYKHQNRHRTVACDKFPPKYFLIVGSIS